MKRIAFLPLSYVFASTVANADVKLEFIGMADTDGTGHADTQVWLQSATPQLLQLAPAWSRSKSYARNAQVSTPDLVNWVALAANAGIDPRHDSRQNWGMSGNQPLPVGSIASGTRQVGIYHVYNNTWSWYPLSGIYNYTIKIFGNANQSGGAEVLAVPTSPLNGSIGQVSASVIDDTARTQRFYSMPGNRPDAPSRIEVAAFDSSGANQAALVYGTLDAFPRVLQPGQQIQPMVFFIDDRLGTTWQGPDFSGTSRQSAINTTAAVDGVWFEDIDATPGKEVLFGSALVAYGGISYASRTKWTRQWGNTSLPWAHAPYMWAFGQIDGTLGSEIYEVYAFGIFVYNRSTNQTDSILWGDPYYNLDPVILPTGLWDPFTNISTANSGPTSPLYELSFQSRPYDSSPVRMHFGFGSANDAIDFFQPRTSSPDYFGMDIVRNTNPNSSTRYVYNWKLNYDPMPDPQFANLQLQGGLSEPCTLAIRGTNVATTYTITTDNPALGTVTPTTVTVPEGWWGTTNSFTVRTSPVTSVQKFKVIVTGPGGTRAEREFTLWP